MTETHSKYTTLI